MGGPTKLMGWPRIINLFLSNWVSPEELIPIDNGLANNINIHK
jgi:hypothetical protein